MDYKEKWPWKWKLFVSFVGQVSTVCLSSLYFPVHPRKTVSTLTSQSGSTHSLTVVLFSLSHNVISFLSPSTQNALDYRG